MTATPATGMTDTVDLDYASLTTSQNFGVVASTAFYNLPIFLQTSTVLGYAQYVANPVIENGSIVQGQGQSNGGSALFANSTAFQASNLTLSIAGDDTQAINAYWASNVSITGCTIQGAIARISDRMLGISAINLMRSSGTVVVQNNKITGQLQSGVVLTGYNPSNSYTSVKILNNQISQNSSWTDGYGIAINLGVNNFEVAYNTITPVNGRGIIIDDTAFSSGTVSNGTIHDNQVAVQEGPNLEYGPNEMEATALRIRGDYRTLSGISISNNTFAASTGPGLDWAATGARISLGNANGVNNNSNMTFTNHTFQAIVTAPDPTYTGSYASTAWGVTISGVSPGTGMTFLNNSFVSNVTSLNFGDNDAYGVTDGGIVFIGSTIAKATTGATMSYTGIAAGNWANTVTGVLFVDTTYGSGVTPGVTFLGTGATAEDVEFGVLLQVTVDNAQNQPVAGASVTILDQNGNQVYSGTTNAQGVIAGIPLITTTLLVPAGGNNSQPTTTTTNSFTVQATSGSLLGSQKVTLNADGQVTVQVK